MAYGLKLHGSQFLHSKEIHNDFDPLQNDGQYVGIQYISNMFYSIYNFQTKGYYYIISLFLKL